MTLRFAAPLYPGGRHCLRCGSVTVGVVYPAAHGHDWVWRLWMGDEKDAPHGRAKSEDAAKKMMLARFRGFLRAAELVEAPK